MYAVGVMKALPLLLLLAVAAAAQPSERRAPRRGLIHPLLDTADVEFSELRPFEHRLRELRGRLLKEGKVSTMALYFRDLDNGLAFGLDQQLPFKPASLLKLPIMMALLKKHESDPDLLRRPVTLVESPVRNRVRAFPPSVRLVPGRDYTVDELLTAMIGRSDNDAAHTLLGTLAEADFTRVYEELGLRIPNVRDEEDPVTVREYATFFRILYNASYLSKDHSQKALEYLAASELGRGLRGGVPAAVTVAHKFGESGRAGELQFHDCGIVYHPDKPYLLCVMTRGKDMKALAEAVREASALVYGAVEAPAKKD